MKKRPSLWLIERILLVMCAVFIMFFGRTGVMETSVPAGTKLEDLDIRLIQSEEHVAITDTVIEDNRLKITLKALSVGKASVEVDIHEGYGYLNTAYVHFPKIIMINTYLGQLRGGWILPVSQSLFLAYVIYVLIRKYREKHNVEQDFYVKLNLKDTQTLSRLFMPSLKIAKGTSVTSVTSLVRIIPIKKDSQTNIKETILEE